MAIEVEFAAAAPEAAAAQLDARSVHLWRLRYESVQRRRPFVRLLAAYLGVSDREVALRDGAAGKPELAMVPGAATTLGFNWSHSGDYALFAIARGLAPGVDIERFGKAVRTREVARRFFAAGEADALDGLDGAARARAFIGLWCAKEAVLKASGVGLSFGLARLAFAWKRDADWSLTRTDTALGLISDWQVAGFSAADGYRGALAWRGMARRIVGFDAGSALT